MTSSAAGGAASTASAIAGGTASLGNPAPGGPATTAGPAASGAAASGPAAAPAPGGPAATPGPDPTSIYPPGTANADGSASLTHPAATGKPDPVLNAYQKGMTGLTNDMALKDTSMKDKNFYAINKLQRVNFVAEGVEIAGNKAWDYTAGWVTGSTGLTCNDYYNETLDAVKASVAKNFPGAKVERMTFLTKTEYYNDTLLRKIESHFEPNHTFAKVTLPSGEELAIDFHGANANMLETNPPVVRPYADVRREWKTFMGDEFMEG